MVIDNVLARIKGEYWRGEVVSEGCRELPSPLVVRKRARERERERDNRGDDAEDAAYAAEVCVYHLSGGEKVESDES